jgi:hypothetical protein
LQPSKSGADFAKHAHSALQRIGKQSNPPSPLTQLLYYEQVCARPGRSGRKQNPSVRLFLKLSLQEFRQERPKEATLLMRRYLEGETVKEIAHTGNTSQETINRNQHLALRLFAEWLGEQEAAAWTALQNSTLAALPPKSFGRLFGHQSEASRLFRRLASAEAPWVIAVTGIGGIGKTSLINQVARRLAASPRYKRMIWLQADEAGLNEQRLIEDLSRRLLPVGLPASRRLSALQAVLKATPTLVVLDNLDSEVNKPAWVDRLHSLANPSKFVICSRVAPAALARAYRFTLNELDTKTASELMQHQAGELGLERAQSAIQRSASAIYARTGGNPLALKLVVGLMFALPLGTILSSFEGRLGRDIGEIYDHIYRLSWNSLSKDAKRTLLAMLLVSEQGAGWPQLKAISSLGDARLQTAVMELRGRSLLELSSPGNQPRYAIHQLTRTFLRKELLNE